MAKPLNFMKKKGKMYQHMLKLLSKIIFIAYQLKQVRTGHTRIGIVREKTNEPPLRQSIILAIVHILTCVLGSN
jgi:hypothetical protein